MAKQQSVLRGVIARIPSRQHRLRFLVSGLLLLTLAACGSTELAEVGAPSASTPASSAGATLRLPAKPADELATAAMPANINNDGAQPTAKSPAPDFALRYADGAEVRLSDLRGHPILINFWATWCGPCRLEMPDIVAAYEKHKDAGFIVIAVNLEESADKIKPFAEELGMALPIVMDDGLAARAYQVRVMPSSFFIDREGKISARWLGVLTPSLIEKNLAPIL
jgi:thiol-disulfide isomerase/thioredoxin